MLDVCWGYFSFCPWSFDRGSVVPKTVENRAAMIEQGKGIVYIKWFDIDDELTIAPLNASLLSAFSF